MTKCAFDAAECTSGEIWFGILIFNNCTEKLQHSNLSLDYVKSIAQI